MKIQLDPRVEKAIFAIIVIGLLIKVGLFIHTQKPSAWDFRNNLWGPAHLLTLGKAPYDILQLFEGSNAVMDANGCGSWGATRLFERIKGDESVVCVE